MATAEKIEGRKVIHIDTGTTTTGQIILVALCDDGTIWYRSLMTENYGEWTRVPDVAKK